MLFKDCTLCVFHSRSSKKESLNEAGKNVKSYGTSNEKEQDNVSNLLSYQKYEWKHGIK